jgi:hypothetical protein
MDSKLSTLEICAILSQSGTASTRRRIAWDWINGDREVDTTVETIGIIGIKPKGKIFIAPATANLISLHTPSLKKLHLLTRSKYHTRKKKRGSLPQSVLRDN